MTDLHPIEYRCSACSLTFTQMQTLDGPTMTQCTSCRGTALRISYPKVKKRKAPKRMTIKEAEATFGRTKWSHFYLDMQKSYREAKSIKQFDIDVMSPARREARHAMLEELIGSLTTLRTKLTDLGSSEDRATAS